MSREVGVPACRSLIAFGRGDYVKAIEALLAERHALKPASALSHAWRARAKDMPAPRAA